MFNNKRKKENKLNNTKRKANRAPGKKVNFNIESIRQNIVKFFRFISDKFEAMFLSDKMMLVVTFFIALLLVQNVHSLGGAAITKNISSMVKDAEVTSTYDKEKFVVEGLPETVNLILFGDDAAVQQTRNTKSYSVAVDLDGYGAGTHLVDVDVNNLPNNVKAQADPNRVQVNIYTKEFAQFEIQPMLIGMNSLDGLSMQDAKLAESTISLKGAKKDLDRVSYVRALIDGKAINASLNEKTPQEYNGRAAVIAYDESGQKIENISDDSSGVEYTVNLVSQTGKPINTLNPIIVGNLPAGKAIKSFSLETDAVTINGADEEVAKIASLDVKFDLKNITKDSSIEGKILIPDDAKITSVSPNKISAKVEFGDAAKKTISVSSVSLLHPNNDKYKYEVSDTQNLTLEITGTEETLATLDESQIKAEIDVADLAVGSQQVTLSVKGPSIYRYKFSQQSVKLTISNK